MLKRRRLCWLKAEADLRSSGTTLARRQTAPATTGEATDVPDSERQPPWMRLPITSRPYATTSGCAVQRTPHHQTRSALHLRRCGRFM
jgi:hypothetical protein